MARTSFITVTCLVDLGLRTPPEGEMLRACLLSVCLFVMRLNENVCERDIAIEPFELKNVQLFCTPLDGATADSWKLKIGEI